jgi:hypothetical protein
VLSLSVSVGFRVDGGGGWSCSDDNQLLLETLRCDAVSVACGHQLWRPVGKVSLKVEYSFQSERLGKSIHSQVSIGSSRRFI